MGYQVTTLTSGLRLVSVSRPSRMTTAVRIYARAGSRYDGQHQGKAHFVEHMLFNGTANRSAQQIYGDIESLGGMIQANTTREYTTYGVVVMDRYLEMGLDVLADVIANPVFDSVAFLKEKLVIMREINRAQDSRAILLDLFSEIIWAESPIRQSTLGNLESLRDLEYEEVLDFYLKRYNTGNMVISICGDVNHDYLVKQISQRFSHLRQGDELRPLPVVEPPFSKRTVHIEKDIHETYFIVGVQATDMKDGKRYAVKLMDRILGSGGSSRLSQKLREDKKYVYTVYSLASMYEDAGYFAVYTSCNPDDVPEVESLILEEWERLKTEPVGDEELEAAKRVYEGTLAKDCETNLFVAGILGIEALLHKIEPFDEAIEKINSVTKHDIMDVANRYLNTSEYAMVTVGRNLE